jgi:hypothetical protein
MSCRRIVLASHPSLERFLNSRELATPSGAGLVARGSLITKQAPAAGQNKSRHVDLHTSTRSAAQAGLCHFFRVNMSPADVFEDEDSATSGKQTGGGERTSGVEYILYKSTARREEHQRQTPQPPAIHAISYLATLTFIWVRSLAASSVAPFLQASLSLARMSSAFFKAAIVQSG